jgi:hypothetical protein
MLFEYQLALNPEKSISDWEKSLDSNSYYIFLNGSYGDIYTFLSIYATFLEVNSYPQTTIYAEPKWNNLISRYLTQSTKIVNLQDYSAANYLLVRRILNSFGQIQAGRIFMSCITCHPNIPELVTIGYLSQINAYRYLLRLREESDYTQPPETEHYSQVAKEKIPANFESAKKNVLFSFLNNTNQELPSELIISMRDYFLSNNYEIYNNVTSTRGADRENTLQGTKTLIIPPELPGEMLDNFDIFVTGVNGLQTVAMLASKKCKILVLSYSEISTKSNDWAVRHTKETLSKWFAEFKVPETRVLYLFLEEENQNWDSLIAEPILKNFILCNH